MSAPTKVYLFQNYWTPYGDQGWAALAEDGRLVCAHISSSRSWGLHDVSPKMHYQDYAEAFGSPFEVELVEVPEGELPPHEVLTRFNHIRAEHG